MDYEKAYKEVLEKAKKELNTCGSLNCDAARQIFRLFPELAESEDERIRKILIEDIKDTLSSEDFKRYNPEHAKKLEEALAWLEKQNGQKPVTIDIDKMVDDYANNKERGNEEFGKPVPCMVRAYRQGLSDAIGKVVLKSAWIKNKK